MLLHLKHKTSFQTVVEEQIKTNQESTGVVRNVMNTERLVPPISTFLLVLHQVFRDRGGMPF